MKKIMFWMIIVIIFSVLGVLSINVFAETVEYTNRNEIETKYNIGYYSEGGNWTPLDIPKASIIKSVSELNKHTTDINILSKYDEKFFTHKAIIWIDAGVPNPSYSLRVSEVENTADSITILISKTQDISFDVIQATYIWDIILEIDKTDVEVVKVNINEIEIEPSIPAEPEVWFDGGTLIVPPNKTVYIEGEVLDLTGLKVYETAGIVYTDGSVSYTMMEERIPDVEMENKPLTVNDTTITVSVGIKFVSFPVTDTFEITVYPKSTIQFLDSDGNAVESLKSSDVIRGNAVCSTSVSEKSGVYMALYDKDGVLKDVKFSLQPVKTDENITFTTESMTIPENSEGYYVKMFLWTDGLEPLSNTVTIK